MVSTLCLVEEIFAYSKIMKVFSVFSLNALLIYSTHSDLQSSGIYFLCMFCGRSLFFFPTWMSSRFSTVYDVCHDLGNYNCGV